MITAKHESCLCKSCENFGCYKKGLAKALELLLDAYKGSEPTEDDEGDPMPLHSTSAANFALAGEPDDPILADPRFQKLLELNNFERRYEKVQITFLGVIQAAV